MYSHVTTTCIKTWVVPALLPSKYPTIQQWNCYPESQHHRLVLPVLELHLYGIVQYVILCLSSFCSASCEVHPAAFWSFLHLLSSVVVNDYASIFTLLFLKIIFFWLLLLAFGNPSSSTRDPTCALCSRHVESQPVDCRENPNIRSPVTNIWVGSNIVAVRDKAALKILVCFCMFGVATSTHFCWVHTQERITGLI